MIEAYQSCQEGNEHGQTIENKVEKLITRSKRCRGGRSMRVGFAKLSIISIFLLLSIGASEVGSQTQRPKQSELTVKIDTDLVVTDALVVSKKTGRVIGDLKREDFLLYEDGVRQEITHFSQDKLPLSVMLLLDVSG